MSELPNIESNEKTVTPWDGFPYQIPDRKQKLENLMSAEQINAKINAIEQAITDIDNGSTDEFRLQKEDEKDDDYDSYLQSYIRGQRMISDSKRGPETSEECAKRLKREYQEKLEQIKNMQEPTEPKAA